MSTKTKREHAKSIDKCLSLNKNLSTQRIIMVCNLLIFIGSNIMQTNTNRTYCHQQRRKCCKITLKKIRRTRVFIKYLAHLTSFIVLRIITTGSNKTPATSVQKPRGATDTNPNINNPNKIKKMIETPVSVV